MRFTNCVLIKNASQILTMQGESNHNVGMIENGYLFVRNGIIENVGYQKDMNPNLESEPDVKIIDASGKTLIPGFVDAHTHVVFGGSRVAEYTVKLTDSNPETLKKLGIETGIYASVHMTRDLPLEKLAEQSEGRMRRMMINGTTTLESKSGYGLTLSSEMKMLEVNKLLGTVLPIDIVSTFLGGHGWDENMKKEEYIDFLCNTMIPQVAKFKMATFNDVWCDEGHFTAEDSRKILSTGLEYGLIPTIHTDAYSYIGGSDLAAEMKMASAVHLNYTPQSVFPKLKEANVVGIVLPAIDFAVNHPKPFNPRPMLDCGMTLALATNCCPGNWCVSMPFVLTLACRRHGFTPAEAFRAATYGGAKALTLEDRGVLAKGKVADLILLNTPNFENLIYQYGEQLIELVIKNGEIIVRDGHIQ
ncbi:MAG: imidazolonepropionase [Acidaminococcus sp.]|jgi:imidazolonepropionase|nr:imidazolonepropionase [Acidaminococcus sp.]